MLKGNISFYCKILNVSREGFRQYLLDLKRPWKYEHIVDLINILLSEDEYNDMYGRIRMYEALKYRFPSEYIPSEHTINRIMEKANINNHLRRPKGITKKDLKAEPSNNLLKRDFYSDKPYVKMVTDITEIPALDGKLYVSAIFDCFNLKCLSLEMQDNMRAELCVETLRNAYKRYPEIRGGKIHSDQGKQYTSDVFRKEIKNCGVLQSMNSAGGRCHDNARCEAMWARLKWELFYKRYDTIKLTKEQIKKLVWRYFMSYWNNRRICSAIGGIPPIEKERRYYAKYNRNAI